jgi:hypothetical protein
MSRRLRRTLLIVGGLALVATSLLLALYLGFRLAVQHEPAFYREALEIDPAVLEKQSDRMLQRTTALASAVKKEGRWEALFTAEQINGWLAVDMVKNHPHTLPPTMRDPRVAIGPKEVTIACRFEHRGAESVLSLTVEPYVPEPNVVALRIVKARAGLLPVPLRQVIDRVTQAARDMRLTLQWKQSGSDPVALFSLPPSDDRPVCVETLRLGDGEIYVAGTTRAGKP